MNFKTVEMPWGGRDVPHGVVEVNQLCNINCFGCCKDKFNYSKSLDEIKTEIDLLFAKRNLAAISLAGGEPLLYEHIFEAVAYINSKNIRSIILTNGTLVTPEILKKLRTAGLSRLVFHIDGHQHGRPDVTYPTSEKKLNSLRAHYLQLCLEAKQEIGFTVTVYQDSLEELKEVLLFCQNNPTVKFLLVMGYSQLVNYNEKISDKYKRSDLSIGPHDTVNYMKRVENATPLFYIPSSHNQNSARWNFYVLSIVDKNRSGVEKLYLTPRIPQVFEVLLFLQRKLKGRFGFDDPSTTVQIIFTLSVHALFSCSLSTIYKTIKIFALALKYRNIRFQTYTFQYPPNQIGENEFEICKNCPDITVRNGNLVPTCLADVIDPLLVRNQI